MISKFSLFVVFVSLGLLIASCAKLPITQSRWAPTMDHTAPYSGYDAESKVSWQISNDAENLFVNLRSPRPDVSHNIIQNGMQVMVDTLGKKKGQFALKYPLGMNAGEFGKPMAPKPGEMPGTGMSPFELDAPREGGWIIDEEITYLDNQKQTLGFDYDLFFDSLRTLNYTASIPLKQIWKNGSKPETFSIGIVMKAGTVTTPGSSGAGMNMAGNSPGSNMPGSSMPGTGMAASNRPGSMSGGSGTNLQQDGGSIKIWTAVQLASPK